MAFRERGRGHRLGPKQMADISLKHINAREAIAVKLTLFWPQSNSLMMEDKFLLGHTFQWLAKLLQISRMGSLAVRLVIFDL